MQSVWTAKTYCSNSPVESPPHNEKREQFPICIEAAPRAWTSVIVDWGLVVSLTGDMAGLRSLRVKGFVRLVEQNSTNLKQYFDMAIIDIVKYEQQEGVIVQP